MIVLRRCLTIRGGASAGSRGAGIGSRRPRLTQQTLLGLRSSIVARSRVVDDRVRAVGVSGPARYVAVGAGLDTLAWRRPDLELEVV